MRRLLSNIVFLYILLGALALLLVLSFLRKPTPIIAPADRVTLDSLTRLREGDQHIIDSLRSSALTHSTAGASAAGRARASEATASAIRTRADTAASRALRTDPAASDSLAAAWRQAYTLRTEERDTLLVALAQKDSAYRNASSAANDNRLALTKLTDRNDAVEKLNSSLATALTKAERGCRVLWTVPCPSRKVTLIGGVVLGAAGYIALTK